ncbi:MULTISPECIES: YdcF family protein [unclassified Microbacterium]|uniref:YdcF family protein n=1 Tax=unclassified Microbacterium TaxID=2609290 RepID=UPI00301B027A
MNGVRRRATARPSVRRALAPLGVLGVGLLAFGEVQAWWASRAEYPSRAQRRQGPGDGRDVVLVLGFRSREDGRPNAVQTWRTRIAARSAPPGALFVFSGGAVRGPEPEAVVMARIATSRLGIAPDDIAIEPEARSTRENLSRSLPWLRAARTIRLASNTSHARRARRYLRELDPGLWRRLRRTRDVVPLELGPLRLAVTFYDAVAARRAARGERDGG